MHRSLFSVLILLSNLVLGPILLNVGHMTIATSVADFKIEVTVLVLLHKKQRQLTLGL